MNPEKELASIFDDIQDWKSMPSQHLSIMKKLIANNEWGVAFENLCENLYEFDVPISNSIFDRIKS